MTAASAAGAAVGAHAEVVQITQSNNSFSTEANQLKKDLTGDSLEDIATWIFSASSDSSASTSSFSTWWYARVLTASFSTIASAWAIYRYYSSSSTSTSSFRAKVGFPSSSYYTSDWDGSPTSVTSFVYLNFTDARINNGSPTSGFVELTARNDSLSRHTITLNRLIFDDADATGTSLSPDTKTVYKEWTGPAEKVESTSTLDPAVIKQIEKRIDNLQEKLRRYKSARFGRSILGNKLKKQQKRLRRQIRQLKARMNGMSA